MATIAQRFAQVIDKGGGKYIRLPEKASQTFKKDYPLKADATTKRVEVLATDDVAMTGFACEDATGVEDHMTLVFVPTPQTEILFNVNHATPGSAVTANTLRTAEFGCTVSSGKMYCDIDDTTNKIMVVEDLWREDALGDQYGRVIAKIRTASLQTTV